MLVTDSNTVARAEPSGLTRGLGLCPATAIVIGDTIGTGVFLVSSDMARAVGAPTLVLAAWIIGGVIVFFWGLLLCRTGRGIPESRGPV
jgi:APA family basic amino acid/polyamine antiporter